MLLKLIIKVVLDKKITYNIPNIIIIRNIMSESDCENKVKFFYLELNKEVVEVNSESFIYKKAYNSEIEAYTKHFQQKIISNDSKIIEKENEIDEFYEVIVVINDSIDIINEENKNMNIKLKEILDKHPEFLL